MSAKLMNKQPKQMIVDRGEMSKEFSDWALMNGIEIVSPSHSRGDRKGQIERILQAQNAAAFQRLRRHDK